MPTTLAAASTLAQDPAFQGKVTAALMFRARSVIADLPENVPEFSMAFAKALARNPAPFVVATSWVLAADSSMPDVPTDAQLLAALDRAWNALAGL